MPLTPNNREEHWLKGMVDGSTTLTPNKRQEYWYQEIINAQGGGGGGGYDAVIEICPTAEPYSVSVKSGNFADCYAKASQGNPINISVYFNYGMGVGVNNSFARILGLSATDEDGWKIQIVVAPELIAENDGTIVIDPDYYAVIVWNTNGITIINW